MATYTVYNPTLGGPQPDAKGRPQRGRSWPFPTPEGQVPDSYNGSNLFLVESEGAVPAFDDTTHRLDGREWVYDEQALTAVHAYKTPVLMTQEELDAKAEAEADEATRQQLKTAYQTFKDGNATNAQAQKAIAWLIKQIATLD